MPDNPQVPEVHRCQCGAATEPGSRSCRKCLHRSRWLRRKDARSIEIARRRRKSKKGKR
jgi:ribosomal protein L40E